MTREPHRPRVTIAGDDAALAERVAERHERWARERRLDRLMGRLLSVPPPAPRDGEPQAEEHG